MNHRLTRRNVLALAGGLGLANALAPTLHAQEAGSPVPESEWTITDVLGRTVTLSERPVRIAANLGTAAALWDFGIRPVAVFDWTASEFPDGDHIAWGNIDPTAVVNIGDAEGNIQVEELILVEPDIILTLTYDPENPADTSGVHPDLAETINQIAPVAVVTDMGSTALQLERLIALGELLGADLSDPDIVAARTAYEAKLAEFGETVVALPDVDVLFMDFDPTAIYVAGPRGVAELQFLSDLGLKFANADSPAAGDFWETLSTEEALRYQSDVIFNDVYSTLKTLEDLRAEPTLAVIPAIAAGQVGLWTRDFPVSYAGVTTFLEVILSTLRDAQDLSA